jgi:hypothetical protein
MLKSQHFNVTLLNEEAHPIRVSSDDIQETIEDLITRKHGLRAGFDFFVQIKKSDSQSTS